MMPSDAWDTDRETAPANGRTGLRGPALLCNHLAMLLLLACTSPTLEATMLIPSDPLGTALEFSATVRIDPRSSSKRLQGVWLERADGTRWLIDYRARDCWRPLEDIAVTTIGERYEPQGQAISAPHFRVSMLQVLTVTPEATVVAVGPEQVMTGTLQTSAGAPGTKSEGSTWMVFQNADGPSGPLYNPSALGSLTGAVTLTVREVELSPFSTHIGGPQFCILNARSVTP